MMGACHLHFCACAYLIPWPRGMCQSMRSGSAPSSTVIGQGTPSVSHRRAFFCYLVFSVACHANERCCPVLWLPHHCSPGRHAPYFDCLIYSLLWLTAPTSVSARWIPRLCQYPRLPPFPRSWLQAAFNGRGPPRPEDPSTETTTPCAGEGERTGVPITDLPSSTSAPVSGPTGKSINLLD